jgi:hypothetical protein
MVLRVEEAVDAAAVVAVHAEEAVAAHAEGEAAAHVPAEAAVHARQADIVADRVEAAGTTPAHR